MLYRHQDDIDKMNDFQWIADGNTKLPELDFEALQTWLAATARQHSMIVGDLNYIFCNDEKILQVNRDFLDHDYYTDIITFDRSSRGMIRGDIYISLETVASNAADLNVENDRELRRVIVHGLLHLCGIDDKGPGQREIMEKEEDKALELFEISYSLPSIGTFQ